MEKSWRRKWKVVRKWNSSTNTADADTADADTASLSLQDADGLRVRNSGHNTSSETLCLRKILFVNRIVHDPRLSWTEVWLYLHPVFYKDFNTVQ